MLPWMFISSYTTIYFFVKNFFFSNVYISVNTIFESSYLFFGWEIGHPWREAHPKCVQLCTAGQWYHASCVRTHLLYHFSSFCLVVFCFICRTLTLLLLKEDVFLRNCYLSPMKSISVVMKLAFFPDRSQPKPF